MKPDLKRLLLQNILPSAGIAIAAAFVLFCCVSAAIPLECENTVNVYDSTVRLRVVANSDSAADRALQLEVRNDIIGMASEIFEDCHDIDTAKEKVLRSIDALEFAAQRSVEEHGADYPVKVSLVTEECPVRRYSEFTFPAGEYNTLRIDIGEAAGENWWCVMYPPLCVSTAVNDVYVDEQAFLDCGFTSEQIDSLKQPEQKKEIRFAIADFFAGFFD